MSLQFHQLIIPSYAGINLQLSLAGSGSKRLMVLLPGLGYYVHSPLFHYLRQIAWQHHDDVLAVQYGFQITQANYEEQHVPAMTQESQQAVEEALKHGAYEELVFIGKSLGSPMAALFANHFPQATKALLLTPIQDCHKLIQKTPSLAVIGTADSRYSPELVQDTALVKWQVVEGLNHSLEMPDDYQASIQKMGEIMKTCESFLYP